MGHRPDRVELEMAAIKLCSPELGKLAGCHPPGWMAGSAGGRVVVPGRGKNSSLELQAALTSSEGGTSNPSLLETLSSTS